MKFTGDVRLLEVSSLLLRILWRNHSLLDALVHASADSNTSYTERGIDYGCLTPHVLQSFLLHQTDP